MLRTLPAKVEVDPAMRVDFVELEAEAERQKKGRDLGSI
jgi:hypothetical protein